MTLKNNSISNAVIKAYLREHGKMSGRDICDDLGVEEIEVQMAEQDGVIAQTSPEPGGGGGAWYRAR